MNVATPTPRSCAGLALLAGALTCLSGCGSRLTHPVQGKVVYKGTGDPFPGGRVEFEPLETDDPKRRVSATGEIQKDGSFRLGTFKPGDGAVEGVHRVLVMPPLPTANVEALMPTPRKSALLDTRFTRFETSGLQFTVTRDAAKNHFVIEVEKPRTR